MIKYLFNIFKSYFTIFLGLFMFCIYIYFRFIRERLPKYIPFNLSVFGFFILVELCCIYGYIVWSYLRPAKNANEIVIILTNEFFKPLKTFDNFIKNLPIIKVYYPRIIIWMAYKLKYIFNTPIFEIVFFLIPRVVLISALIIDIFCFSKLIYIYNVLFIGILLFLRRYIKYSLEKFKQDLSNELKIDIQQILTKYVFGVHPSEWPENYDPEDEDNDDIPPTMVLDFDIFVDYYTNSKVYDNIERPIHMLLMTSNFHDKYKDASTMIGCKITFHINSDAYKQENLKLHELENSFNNLLKLSIIQEYNNYIIDTNIFLKLMRIIIYYLYLLCWLYILYRSFHTLDLAELMTVLNETWLRSEEPF